MDRYQYVGVAPGLLGHTALGLTADDGEFRVQVDDLRHPWSHGWWCLDESTQHNQDNSPMVSMGKFIHSKESTMKYFLMNDEYTKAYNKIARSEKAAIKEWHAYAESLGAEAVNVSVHGGTLLVVGYKFKEDPDHKLFYKPSHDQNNWQPRARSPIAKVMATHRIDTRQQFHDLIGFPSSLFGVPAMISKGKHRIVCCPTHGSIGGCKIEAKSFTPLGCKRITDVEYENITGGKVKIAY